MFQKCFFLKFNQNHTINNQHAIAKFNVHDSKTNWNNQIRQKCIEYWWRRYHCNISKWNEKSHFMTSRIFIKNIYFELKIKISNFEYLNQWTIFVDINKNVNRININCIDRFRNEIFLKYHYNKSMTFETIDEFDDEYFHHYDEISLFFHVFRLKIDMFVMIFRNFKFY